MRRGVIQGDIPSPVCFLVALDKLLKEHSQLDRGLHLTPTLSIAELAYADDCALPGANAETTTSRLTNLDTHAKSLAGMVISVPKTKAQHVMAQPRMSEATKMTSPGYHLKSSLAINVTKNFSNQPWALCSLGPVV